MNSITSDLNAHELMTSLPIQEITYSVVEAFCKLGLEEGTDLDYKADFPNDLGRIICSFANTQGGTVLLGIEEEGKTRKPKTPPSGVEGNPDTLRQRVFNLAFDSIYPAPDIEVQVCAIDGSAERNVIVIRVNPTRLLHSTDRRTRVYIRVVDNNRGYGLAQVDDLRWLWNRREEASSLREAILQSAEAHANSEDVAWKGRDAKADWDKNPRLVVSAVPEFPQTLSAQNPLDLLEVVKQIGAMRSDWQSITLEINPAYGWRTIPNGILVKDRGTHQRLTFVELGIHGSAYYAISHPELMAYAIVGDLDLALQYTHKVSDLIGSQSQVRIKAEMHAIGGMTLNSRPAMERNPLDIEWISEVCPDNQLLLLDDVISLRTLSAKHQDLVLTAAKNLAHGFGLPWDNQFLGEMLPRWRG